MIGIKSDNLLGLPTQLFCTLRFPDGCFRFAQILEDPLQHLSRIDLLRIHQGFLQDRAHLNRFIQFQHTFSLRTESFRNDQLLHRLADLFFDWLFLKRRAVTLQKLRFRCPFFSIHANGFQRCVENLWIMLLSAYLLYNCANYHRMKGFHYQKTIDLQVVVVLQR